MRSLFSKSDRARFWAKVDKSQGCWIWTACRNSKGYGLFTFKLHGKHVRRGAHRVAYLMTFGRIEKGLELDHLCRNRRCVNPSHLEQVTHHENLMRGQTITAIHAAKTHCKHGHEFTPDNTFYKKGKPKYRNCRQCYRGYTIRRRQRS